jgi:hypothetical protein
MQPIRVEVEGVGTLEFPEGTDPGVIDRAVKQEIATRRQQQPRTTDAQPPDDRRSTFARGVDLATTPLIPQIGRAATGVADMIDTAPNPTSRQGGLLSALAGVPDIARNVLSEPVATTRGALAGVVEGAGQVASQMTSPLDAALTLTGLRAVRGAAPLISRGVDIAGNTALALRGAERVLNPESGADIGTGLLQTALGAAGAKVATGRPASPRALAGQTDAPAAIPEPVRPSPLDEMLHEARSAPAPEAQRIGHPRPGDPGDVPDNPVAQALEKERRAVAESAGVTPRKVVSLRRRELQDSMAAREAMVDPSRMNEIRLRAESGEILDRPTTAGPRKVVSLTRRPTMTAEATPSIEPGQARPIDQLPGVTRGPRLAPEDAGFLRWLADDLRENTFQQGGLSKGQLNAMTAEREGLRFVAAGHVAGTPTQKTFNAMGIDATRSELRSAIENLLEGKGGNSPIQQAALKYVAAMREAWTGEKFDFTRVSDNTLQQIGLRSRKELHSRSCFLKRSLTGKARRRASISPRRHARRLTARFLTGRP